MQLANTKIRSKPAKTGIVGFKNKHRFYSVVKMKNKCTLRMVIYTKYCNGNTVHCGSYFTILNILYKHSAVVIVIFTYLEVECYVSDM